MRVSAIIRTLNEARYIEKTLESVKNQFSDLEIIIVDNMSTDNTVEIAAKYCSKIVKISREEFSWGKALNVGIEQATGDLIFVTSGHCIVEPKKLDYGIDFMRSNNLDVVYARQIGDLSKDKFEYIELLKDYPSKSYLVKDSDAFFVCSNAGALFKRSVWEKEKFDESLSSAEDGEWAHRVKNGGYKLGYSADFVIIHGHPYDKKYIYKKWFYRTYVVDKNRNKRDLVLRSTKLFALADTMKKSFEYSRVLSNEKISYSKMQLIKYIYNTEKANRSARRAILYSYDADRQNKCVAQMQ